MNVPLVHTTSKKGKAEGRVEEGDVGSFFHGDHVTHHDMLCSLVHILIILL